MNSDDPNSAEAVSAGKQTIETLMAGERIIEAIDLGIEDLKVVREYEQVTIFYEPPAKF